MPLPFSGFSLGMPRVPRWVPPPPSLLDPFFGEPPQWFTPVPPLELCGPPFLRTGLNPPDITPK